MEEEEDRFTGFNKKTEKIIQEIASQYIEIFKIVKKTCPKSFTTEQLVLIFIKTENVFNSIQVAMAKKNRKKKRNGNGNGNGKLSLPKETKRTKEYYA